MKTLPLSNSDLVVTVSDEHYELAKHITWNVDSKPRKDGSIYVRVRGWDPAKKKTVLLHHYLFGFPPPGQKSDHVDRNALNNTPGNHRFLDNKKSNQNRDFHQFSGLRGVCWDRESCKWRAYISIDGRSKGFRRTHFAVDAALEWNAAAVSIGSIAPLNKISEEELANKAVFEDLRRKRLGLPLLCETVKDPSILKTATSVSNL